MIKWIKVIRKNLLFNVSLLWYFMKQKKIKPITMYALLYKIYVKYIYIILTDFRHRYASNNVKSCGNSSDQAH